MRLSTALNLITPIVLLALAIAAVFHLLAPARPRQLSRSPANAYLWAAHAESLAAEGHPADARTVFTRAIELAPHAPQILMRTVNFCYETSDAPCTLSLGRRILELTATHDAILFTYYAATRRSAEQVLREGVPVSSRAVRSYALDLARRVASPGDFIPVWQKIRSAHLIDDNTAAALSSLLYARKFSSLAASVWFDHNPLPPGEFISNGAFARPPFASPFDWSIAVQPGVTFERTDGLQIDFDGTLNLALATPSQITAVGPGPHRLLVDYTASGVTTDQTPFFRVFDAASLQRINVATENLPGSSARRTLTLEFTVPPETSRLVVRMERAISGKLDHKIAGSLHIYSIRLMRSGPQPRP